MPPSKSSLPHQIFKWRDLRHIFLLFMLNIILSVKVSSHVHLSVYSNQSTFVRAFIFTCLFILPSLHKNVMTGQMWLDIIHFVSFCLPSLKSCYFIHWPEQSLYTSLYIWGTIYIFLAVACLNKYIWINIIVSKQRDNQQKKQEEVEVEGWDVSPNNKVCQWML